MAGMKDWFDSGGDVKQRFGVGAIQPGRRLRVSVAPKLAPWSLCLVGVYSIRLCRHVA